MQKITKNVMKFVSIAMLTSIAIPVYAESAPVYDVDSMPQQFDSGAADQQNLPTPPAPEADTFVPVQPADQADTTMGVPAQAEASSPEPVVPHGSMEQRLRRVEQQINNMQHSERVAKVDSLQEQMQTLRGQVEQMQHDLQVMQTQQKKMYDDLDKRLGSKSEVVAETNSKSKSAEQDSADTTDASTPAVSDDTPGLTPSAKSAHQSTAKAAPTKPAAADAANQPNVAEEQQIYQTAYNFIKAKQYNEAVNALQDMLKKYPSGQFAANAHYWLGELYGLLNKPDLALKEFTAVIKTFPDSPRVSDAQ